MNAVLIKIFATALALSQVTTRPDAVKTQFDPVGDRKAADLVRTSGKRAADLVNVTGQKSGNTIYVTSISVGH